MALGGMGDGRASRAPAPAEECKTCGSQPPVQSKKEWGVLSLAKALTGKHAEPKLAALRREICRQCPFSLIEDGKPVRIYREIAGVGYCGRPWRGPRDPYRDGCGCNLDRKVQYLNAACPRGLWGPGERLQGVTYLHTGEGSSPTVPYGKGGCPMSSVKPGEQTTEFAAAKSGSAWGIIATVLGGLLSIGSMGLEFLGTDTKTGIVAGAVLAIVGIISKCLVDLGYIKSRTDVKAAAGRVVEPDALPPPSN